MLNVDVKPKSLFLLDAIGALCSAFMLAVVLVAYQPFFGIPIQVLHVLAVFPCLFAIYDVGCLIASPKRIGRYLEGIALMNLGYVVLSLGLAFIHQDVLTLFGWMYILAEVMIVSVIAVVEFKVGSTSSICA
jgi:hypothetical protein